MGEFDSVGESELDGRRRARHRAREMDGPSRAGLEHSLKPASFSHEFRSVRDHESVVEHTPVAPAVDRA